MGEIVRRRTRLADMALGGALVAIGVVAGHLLGDARVHEGHGVMELEELTVRRLRVVDERGLVRASLRARERWTERDMGDSWPSYPEGADQSRSTLGRVAEDQHGRVDDVLVVFSQDGQPALRLGASALGGNVLVSGPTYEVGAMVWAGARGGEMVITGSGGAAITADANGERDATFDLRPAGGGWPRVLLLADPESALVHTGTGEAHAALRVGKSLTGRDDVAKVQASARGCDARLTAYSGLSSVTLKYGSGSAAQASNMPSLSVRGTAQDAVALYSGPSARGVNVYGDDGQRSVWMTALQGSSYPGGTGGLYVAGPDGRVRSSMTGRD